MGTRNKGMLCLADMDGTKKAVFMPPQDVAGRTGCYDDRGLPAISGDTSELKWGHVEGLEKPVKGPLAVLDKYLLVDFGDGPVEVDPASPLKQKPAATRPASGQAVRLHGLQFWIKDGELRCEAKKESDTILLWRAKGETPALGMPTVAGDKVFITAAGKDKAKAFVEGRKITDGALVWRRELDDAPLSHVVASSEWAAVATADDKIALFRASDGKVREPLPVGGKPVAPALCGDVLIIAGETRIAAHDLSSSEWIWNYRDQDNIGTATGQPVVLNETIWVGTTKRGLVAIGVHSGRDVK